MRIEVQHNFGIIAKRLQELKDDIQNKVLAQTVNALAVEAQRNMTTEIAAEFNITRREALEYLRIDRATAKAGARFVMARLYAPPRKKGRGFNLIRLVERKVTFAEMRRRKKAGTLAQLRVQIKRGGGPKTLHGAFIANNGRTVFVREGKARLPIKALTTIDVAQMFNTKRVKSRVVAKIKAGAPYMLRDKLAMVIKGKRPD